MLRLIVLLDLGGGIEERPERETIQGNPPRDGIPSDPTHSRCNRPLSSPHTPGMAIDGTRVPCRGGSPLSSLSRSSRSPYPLYLHCRILRRERDKEERGRGGWGGGGQVHTAALADQLGKFVSKKVSYERRDVQRRRELSHAAAVVTRWPVTPSGAEDGRVPWESIISCEWITRDAPHSGRVVPTKLKLTRTAAAP